MKKSTSKTKSATKVAATSVSTPVVATVSRSTNSRKGASYKKLSIPQKLEIITSRKRRGDIQKVASKLNYTSNYVSGVIAGRRKDSKVVNKAYDIARGRKVAEYTV